MTLRFLQNAADPRQQLIPKAPPVQGDLPSGQMPDTTFESTNFLSDLWASIFGGNEFWAWLFSGAALVSMLSWVWSVYSFLAYLFSLIFIVLYIYATIRQEHFAALISEELKEKERIWNEAHRGQKRTSRLDDVIAHSQSENPNDWKLSIIEADIILDQVLKDRGYAGSSLGERLRSITPSQLGSIDDAWEAHKVRNKIAHEGADFVLTRRIADDTIARYMNVFREFGVV